MRREHFPHFGITEWKDATDDNSNPLSRLTN